MKLYGHFLSAPCNKTLLAATACGQDFEYIQLDLINGEHKSADFLSINPVGKVPALKDGDFCLSESDAISRYIANKNESDFYPKDLQVRAVVDQWVDFSSKHILDNMAKVLFNRLFAPMMGVDPNEQSIADGQKYLNQYVPLVEQQLSNSTMLAGETMTLADTCMIAAMDPFEMIEFDLSPYPNVSKWRNNIMAQDFYQKVHKHYAADLPTS